MIKFTIFFRLWICWMKNRLPRVPRYREPAVGSMAPSVYSWTTLGKMRIKAGWPGFSQHQWYHVHSTTGDVSIRLPWQTPEAASFLDYSSGWYLSFNSSTSGASPLPAGFIRSSAANGRLLFQDGGPISSCIPVTPRLHSFGGTSDRRQTPDVDHVSGGNDAHAYVVKCFSPFRPPVIFITLDWTDWRRRSTELSTQYRSGSDSMSRFARLFPVVATNPAGRLAVPATHSAKWQEWSKLLVFWSSVATSKMPLPRGYQAL